MNQISIDFETRSGCDISLGGAYRYAADPTTDILCCSYLLDKKIHTWWPNWVATIIGQSPSSPPWAHGPAQYTAWNSQFDRLIWNNVATKHYDWPTTFVSDWICSAALARTNGLPGSLDNAAKALTLRQKKDARGKALIRLLSCPVGGTPENPVFNEDPQLLREMIRYCEQDVRVEHSILQHLRPFLKQEIAEFHINEKINDRGIGIDVPFAREALTWGNTERKVMEEKMIKVTLGEVERPTQYQRVKKWLQDVDSAGRRRVSKEALRIMTTKGKLSLDKTVRQRLMSAYESNPTLLSDEAIEVIRIAELANKSSTAKFARMIQREVKGRVHGAYVFAGAASTGRFSAHGIQPHNMLRDTVDDFDASRQSLANLQDSEVIHTLAKMMRPTITGDRLHWSDWSNVESRGCPWLSQSPQGLKKLQLFKEQDTNPNAPDVYERTAAAMGMRDRQIGKVAELALQFGGGVGAFQAMARNYGVAISDDEAKEVQMKWRDANQWAKPFWDSLKDAAWGAMTNPKQVYQAGRVAYWHTPHSHNGLGALCCRLPSGRVLSYVAPKFERVPTPWDPEDSHIELTALKANWSPKAGETTWPRYKLWYGVLCENITQAMCADLLRDVLVRFDEAHLAVVLHTHDEVVIEHPEDASEQVVRIMNTPPKWAPGLPLSADINRGSRYKMNEHNE